jgi:hypothetical protein
MGFETIPGTQIQYGLVNYDADGKERIEEGELISAALIEKVKNGVTNVFFFCHGWQGDIPSAKKQFGDWIKAFDQSSDKAKAASIFPKFNPLYIGLHWPSLPFGNETLRGGSFSVESAGSGADLFSSCLEQLGGIDDTGVERPEIANPLRVIVEEAKVNIAPEELPPHVRQAYLDLNAALGLGAEGVTAPPDADRGEFDPDAVFEALNEQGPSFGGINLGGLLGPLTTLSYWTMKKRARQIGEGGMHLFLKELLATTSAHIHLMGHSFGTIVVSSMVGGPKAQAPLPRPVDSLVLVQGAVSLWTYSKDIPLQVSNRKGYFSPILNQNKIRGPLVTTRSKFDKAVGFLYPLASQVSGSADFAPGLPEFGAIGTYGIQGLPDTQRQDIKMLAAQESYSFAHGKVYNLDGSAFITKGDGISGAHSDITGPEVAHAIWAAAFASV